MGFANWNVFGCNYDDSTFRSMADAFVSSGLASAGYKYMLVQECITPAGARDADGRMVVDAVKFPLGFKSLCDYFHSKGLLCGIYTDVAHLTCANYEGSGPGPANPAGHWAIDALTFASWGVDLIEADFCNTEGTNMSALELYTGARDAIAAATAATQHGMVLYQCNWGAEDPWNWAPTVSNLFRCVFRRFIHVRTRTWTGVPCVRAVSHHCPAFPSHTAALPTPCLISPLSRPPHFWQSHWRHLLAWVHCVGAHPVQL